jgi:hypothetical protein
MENDIEKFDPSKLMEGVKDRIKATFVSLIPDDQWEKMVEKELYVFTEGRIKIDRRWVDGGYQDFEVREPYRQQGFVTLENSKEDDISPLQQMIREQLRETFKKNLVEFLDSEEYKGYWVQYGQPQVSKAVQEVLTKNAETVFINFMAGMMQMAIDGMRENILSQLRQPDNYRGY